VPHTLTALLVLLGLRKISSLEVSVGEGGDSRHLGHGRGLKGLLFYYRVNTSSVKLFNCSNERQFYIVVPINERATPGRV
jgi:hypothetical protein